MLYFAFFFIVSIVSGGYYGGCSGGYDCGGLDLKNVLQFNRQSPFDYFYCNEDTLSKENPSGYQAMGPAFKVKATNPNNDPSWVPISRFYAPSMSIHFYTNNAAEITNSANRNVYNLEGVIGYISTQPLPGTQPLLRFYLPHNNNAHFYCLQGTSQCNEAQGNPSKFTPEGTMGYAFPPDNANANYGAGYGDGSYGGGYNAW